MTNNNRITANGVDTYYERQGSGEPLLLLHGGFGSSNDFAAQIPQLAAQFDVIAPDRRAHGRTPDAGPISYALMAEDTIAFMDALGIESAHVAGYSDGGNIGLLMASGSRSACEGSSPSARTFAPTASTRTRVRTSRPRPAMPHRPRCLMPTPR